MQSPAPVALRCGSGSRRSDGVSSSSGWFALLGLGQARPDFDQRRVGVTDGSNSVLISPPEPAHAIFAPACARNSADSVCVGGAEMSRPAGGERNRPCLPNDQVFLWNVRFASPKPNILEANVINSHPRISHKRHVF
jgi:hypothetical protein